MRLEIETVDPRNEAAYRRYYDTWIDASIPGRADPHLWSFEEARAFVLSPAGDPSELFLAREEERPVAAAWLTLPRRENAHLAVLFIAVSTEHRRRGIGAQMFTHVSRRAGAAQRTSLLTQVNVAAGGEESAPAVPFLTKRGFTLRHTEIRRQQALPVADAVLDELAGHAAALSRGYHLVSWTGPCPDQYAEQYASLKSLLGVEAPTGELDRQPARWDIGRLRESEQLWQAQGLHPYTTVALTPDRTTIAGHTQATVSTHHRGRAQQHDTLVLRAHRGQRLGLALKVANLRQLQAAHPEVTRMDTANAERNDAMIAVNAQLGYKIIETEQLWQR